MVYEDPNYMKKYRKSYRKELNESTKKWKQNHKKSVSKYNKKHYEKIKNTPKYKQKLKYWTKRFLENNPNYHKKLYEKNPLRQLKYNIKQLSKLCTTHNMRPHQYKYASISWSKSIKFLDNKMCKNCDSTKNLHAHHIKPKTIFPKLSLKLDNGITLCKSCHNKIHSRKEFEI